MISIFIVDDHQVVREGVRAMLSHEQDMEIIGEAPDGWKALPSILDLRPSITLVDISLPEMNGITLVQELFRGGFAGKVIMLTQYDKEEYIYSSIQSGVSGYLLKDSLSHEITEAIRSVSRGEMYFDPSISKFLLSNYVQTMRSRELQKEHTPLTARETEVLRLAATGHNNKEIAEKLSVSVRTVEFHRSNILHKLHMKDVSALTRYAIKQGLIKP